MPTTTSSTSVPGNTTSISSKDRESVRRRLFPAKTFTESGTQTGPDAAAAAEDEADFKCSICLDQTEKKNVTITECGHKFCTSCLLKHLVLRNTCPNCRTEIEPARAPAIEPLTATIVANIIREEETSIDLTRRIALIGAFQDPEGRAAMILSLSRELAFGAAHSMAGWQGTSDETYHSSWNAYEYNGIDDDDDDDEDEDEDEDDEEGEEGEEDEDNEDNESGSDDDNGQEIAVHNHSGESVIVDDLLTVVTPITPIQIPTLRPFSVPISPIRSPFQSPRFEPIRHQEQQQQQQQQQQREAPSTAVTQAPEIAPVIDAVSIEPTVVNRRRREIDYFDLIVGNVVRVTVFVFVLFMYSR
jgi:hypothetical protein